jgi:hypothetical protein
MNPQITGGKPWSQSDFASDPASVMRASFSLQGLFFCSVEKRLFSRHRPSSSMP